MNVALLVAALSAWSPETSLVSKEVPTQRVTSETVEVASSTWSWSGFFQWTKREIGALLFLR